MTIINISDNTGLFFIKIFHLYGGFFRKTSKLGNYIKGNTVMFKKSYRSRISRKMKKGFVGKFFLKCQKYSIKRLDGSTIVTNSNSGVLLKKKRVFYSKYLFGPTFRNINNKRIINCFKNYI